MNYQIEKPMTLFQKLEILADAAKYDVACTSSGLLLLRKKSVT